MQKKLGLVGGVGYLSTLDYYKGINEGYQKRVKHLSVSGENPPMVIESLNIATAYQLVNNKDWISFTKLFVNAVNLLYNAGADFAAIAANTAHIVFDEIQSQSPIPLISIVEETCKVAKKRGCQRLVIFGTGFTMSSSMFDKKCSQYDIEVIMPNEIDKQTIHNIIFPSLEAGIVTEKDRQIIHGIANKMLYDSNADALVLGCTELSLVLDKNDFDVHLLDTGKIHIDAILDYLFCDK
jgi:aspartate racemase